jgi:hypothetical protein
MEFRAPHGGGKKVEQLPKGCISELVLKALADGSYPVGSFMYERNWPHASTCSVVGALNCTARLNKFKEDSESNKRNEEAKEEAKKPKRFLGFGRRSA